VVERGIGKRQRAGVGDLKTKARIAVVALGVLDVGLRKVHAHDTAYFGILNKAGGQAAGPATHIEDAFGGANPGKGDERRRQPAAPSAHLQLVTIAVGGNERG
jgi:hypothetical protein